MTTKYYKTWEEYRADNPDVVEMEKAIAPKIQSYEERMFGFIMFLCV